MSSLGARIAYLRNKEGLSQEEFSKVLKIAKSTLGMYETDKREPSHEMSDKIAKHFNVTLDWLLTGKEKDGTDMFLEFLELELTDEEIIERMTFKIDNMILDDEDVREFIAFVRAKRFMKMRPSAGSSDTDKR